jgi:undecaprenyl-diphosphatase
MTWLQAFMLALIQGITEFLPISSSAHLILTSYVFDWPMQDLSFDVALHFGTLFAVLAYFRRDIIPLIKGMFIRNDHSLLAKGLFFATLPAAIVGFLAHDVISQNLRSLNTIIVTTIGFGLLLGLADWLDTRRQHKNTITLTIMILIGFTQILSLIPGTSRSGVTMTAGLFLGLSRKQASRFSFLLAIPIILLASVFEGYQCIIQPSPIIWQYLIIAIIASMLSAYACIALFLKFIDSIGFLPFTIYRVFLGVGLYMVQ